MMIGKRNIKFVSIGAIVAAALCNGAMAQSTGLPDHCADYVVEDGERRAALTRCVRDGGRLQYERTQWTDDTASVKIIRDGQAFLTEDGDAKVVADDGLETFLAGLNDATPLGQALAESLGFAPTEETATIANVDCMRFASLSDGSICLSETGVLLAQTGLDFRLTATSVRLGERGDDAWFDVPAERP